jgi:hypothetical protein
MAAPASVVSWPSGRNLMMLPPIGGRSEAVARLQH